MRWRAICIVFVVSSSGGGIPAVQAQQGSSNNNNNACTVCPDGSVVRLPEQTLALAPPFSDSVPNCGVLDQLAPILLTADSTECKAIRQVSTYCGCPLPNNACNLCDSSTNAVLGNPQLQIQFEQIPSDIIIPTCGMAQAFLHSIQQDSDTCTAQKRNLIDQGCFCTSGDTDNNNMTDPDSILSTCQLCDGGAPPAFADKNVGYLLGDNFPYPEAFSLENITCSTVDLLLRQVEENSALCTDARFLLVDICGCPPQQDPLASKTCNFCGNVQTLPDPERMVYSIQQFGFPPATCQDIQLFLDRVAASDDLCLGAKDFEHLCDCGNGRGNSFRVDQSWLVRLSGCLSWVGSICIVVDVFFRIRPKQWKMFHQLIAAISIFDLFSSIAYVLSLTAMNKVNEYGESIGIDQAKGNEFTCTLQGFLIQLGFTAAFYQISLTAYYVCIIAKSMTEAQVFKYKYFFHIPLIVGPALAFGGIPLYSFGAWVCYIPPPPLSDDYQNTIIFSFIPIAITALLTSINMITVYVKVRKQVVQVNRWNFTNQAQNSSPTQRQGSQLQSSFGKFVRRTLRISSRASGQPRPQSAIAKMERELFWQCVLYLSTFYISWTFMILALIEKYGRNQMLWGFISFLAPLQGFNNALIYFRPRAMLAWKQLQERRRNERLRRQNAKASGPTDSNTTGEQISCTSRPPSKSTVSYGQEVVEREESLIVETQLADKHADLPLVNEEGNVDEPMDVEDA